MPQDYANRARSILTYAYGATLLLIGLDKVFQTNLIVDWQKYVGPLAQSMLPVDILTFTMILGIAEIVLGAVFLFTRFTRIAAYIMIAVLALIVVNLLSMGLYDIAARDVLIALGAFVLVLLSSQE
jgi:uncharacterized membrane protein YphA (DoxX/SURF4 family)